MTISRPENRSTGRFRFEDMPDPLFCLDMANNHQGDVEHGMKLINAVAGVAQRTGTEIMVKLQFRQLESFLHPADRFAYPDGPLSRHSKRFEETALTRDEFRRLVGHARSLGLHPYATPFDEASVDLCVAFDFEVIKIGSCSAYDWPLLRKVASTRLPVICSVGGLALNEIDDITDSFRSSGCPLALLHCIAAYPTPVEHLQLDQIRQLKERYPQHPIGYSGHESPEDIFVVGLAVAKGATILERHVGLPTETVTLNAYSLSPAQAEAWIHEAQRAVRACANGQPRRDAPGERESLMSLRRGIYARHAIPAGKTVTEADVFLAMPCLEGYFHAGKLYEIVGSFTPFETIHVNMPVGLSVRDRLPKSLVMSSIAARVNEILVEARIELDVNSRIELSHHYGFERFFEYGAVIIEVLNRDYCKKLIIQFPDQSHPAHRHHQKEETFQVISGRMKLVLNGQEKELRAGETQVIERDVMHSFSTDSGVVFEEISTTHIKGDSEYEDPNIPSDPTFRKTELVLP